MTTTFKPYPKYKPSGVEWLGDIPASWVTQRISSAFREITRKGYPNEELLSVYRDFGVIPKNSRDDNFNKASEDLSSYQLVNVGDLVLNKMKTWQGSIAISSCRGIVSPAYHVAIPTASLHSRFTHHALRSPIYITQYHRASKGIRLNQWDLPFDSFKELQIVVPPKDEAENIANFLDSETAKIDETIKELEASVELLNEEKTSLINEYVTGKINPETGKPYPKYKPSGVEWLGDIPEHWEVKKLSWLFSYAKGSRASTLTKEYIGMNQGEYPVFSGQTENEGLMGKIDWHEFNFASPVVFVTTVGAKAMSTRLISGQFSLSQNCALIIPRNAETNLQYFEPLFQCLFDYERRSISLIMQPSLRFDDLNRFRVPLPPRNDQDRIAEILSTRANEVSSLISEKESLIETLKEYRTSLIHEAVTGKIDLRNA